MKIKKSVLDYFYEICAIPRGSGNTDEIADYCVGIAKELGLWYKKDEFNNVIIKKDATDKEKTEPIIIQGHLDMVCAKEDGLDFDFEKDGIKWVKDGDFIRAEGTTLGADNGIAIAYALALLSDDDIASPPLEVVFTSDEETGMVGANNMDTSDLKSRRLINIDSEEEGVFTVSCAGGARGTLSYEFKKEKTEGTEIEISVSGVTGGHSGVEIHKRGQNANKVIFSLLNEGIKAGAFNIISAFGGDKDNAIATSASARIITARENAEETVSQIYEKFDSIKASSPQDPEMVLEVRVGDDIYADAIDSKRSQEIVDALSKVKNGVVDMDENNPELVKTSLNVGVVETSEGAIKAVFSLRSNDNSELDRLIEHLENFAKETGASFEAADRYPAWEYVKDSALRDVMIDLYREKYGKEPIVTAIHAGLECGVFAGKLGTLDAVSIGPWMYDVHTVRERVSISSVMRVWEFLQDVLKRI